MDCRRGPLRPCLLIINLACFALRFSHASAVLLLYPQSRRYCLAVVLCFLCKCGPPIACSCSPQGDCRVPKQIMESDPTTPCLEYSAFLGSSWHWSRTSTET